MQNALSGRHKYWAQHKVNRPRGSGSVDKAPDSQMDKREFQSERRTFLILQNVAEFWEKFLKNLNKFGIFYWNFESYLENFENLNFLLLSRPTAGWNVGVVFHPLRFGEGRNVPTVLSSPPWRIHLRVEDKRELESLKYPNSTRMSSR